MHKDLTEIIQKESLKGEIIPINASNTVNQVYQIGELILRLKMADSPRGEDLGKIDNFVHACNMLKKNQIPCPDITSVGKLADKEYVIYKKITGNPIFDLIKEKVKLDDQSSFLIEQSALTLKKLHAIKPNSLDTEYLYNASDYVQNWLNNQIEILTSDRQLDKSTSEKIHTIFAGNKHLFLNYSPTFVHMDFHLGNILTHDNKITGIIDFDRSIFSDPLLDFSSHQRHFHKLQFGTAASNLFISTYFFQGIDSNTQNKLNLYTLFYYIKQLPVAYKYFGDATVNSFKSEIANILAQYD